MDMVACALALELRLHSHVRRRRSGEAERHLYVCASGGPGGRAPFHESSILMLPHLAAASDAFLNLEMLRSHFRRPSQAELAVLYPILQTRLGDNGRQWAIRAAAASRRPAALP